MPNTKGKARLDRKNAAKSKAGAKTTCGAGSAKRSTDGKQLLQYLNRVLEFGGDQESRSRSRLLTQGKAPSSNENMSTYLKGILQSNTSERSRTQKAEYLLGIATSCCIFSEDFSDSLVDEAKDLLPSLALRALADSVIQDSRRTAVEKTSRVPRETGTTLLDYLSKSKRQRSSMEVDEQWRAFLSVCTVQELPYIFRQLLRLGEEDFISNATDQRSRDWMSRGLIFVLTSQHSVQGLSLLLREEVEQYHGTLGTFFHTTELGALLCLNTLSSGDFKPEPLWEDKFTKTLWTRVLHLRNDTERIHLIDAALYNVWEVLSAVRRAFSNILTSKVPSYQQSLLNWVASVFTCNTESRDDHGIGLPDSFLFSVAAVLLATLEPFLERHTKGVDFSHYSSAGCRVNAAGETSLTGEVIATRGKTSEATRWTLTEAELVEELFFFCQRAIGVCYLPLLHHYCLLTSEGVSDACQEKIRSLLGLNNEIVTDDDIGFDIARLYKEQCKLLLPLLTETNSDKGHDAEELRKKASEIPDFFMIDMADWIHHFSATANFPKLLKHVQVLDIYADVCIRLLKSPVLVTNQVLCIRSAMMLQTLTRFDKERSIIQKIIAEREQLVPCLLRMYVHNSVVVESCLDNDHLLLPRSCQDAIICLLHDVWASKKVLRILLELCKTVMFQEYLIAFLNELQHLVFGIVYNPKEMCRSEVANLSSSLQSHVTLLENLVTFVTFSSLLTKYPLLHHLTSTLDFIAAAFFDQRALICCDQIHSAENMDIQMYLCRIIHRLLYSLYLTNSKDFLAFIKDSAELNLHIFERDSIFKAGDSEKMLPFYQELDRILPEARKAMIEADESWMATCLQTPVDEDTLLETYQIRLQHARLSMASLVQSHGFRHVLVDANPTSPKMGVLAEEMQRLERSLSLNLSHAMFLVQDEERRDVLRCMMSGPVGTPYSRGLFTFDIYCPDKYPRVPPLVRLVSSVNGAVFFAPHIKRNVLSLISLQKIYGAHMNEESWSITQVLLLIKAMMLSFLKGSFIDKKESGVKKLLWISKVRALTVRHAMLEPLRAPPPGLEKVVRLHFAVQRQALLKQCARWVQDCADKDAFKWDLKILYRELQAPDMVAIGMASATHLAPERHEAGDQ